MRIKLQEAGFPYELWTEHKGNHLGIRFKEHGIEIMRGFAVVVATVPWEEEEAPTEAIGDDGPDIMDVLTKKAAKATEKPMEAIPTEIAAQGPLTREQALVSVRAARKEREARGLEIALHKDYRQIIVDNIRASESNIPAEATDDEVYRAYSLWYYSAEGHDQRYIASYFEVIE
jgi:hypothetical protein